MYSDTHTHMQFLMHTHTHACSHTHTGTLPRTHTHTHTHTHISLSIYIYILSHANMYICTYACTYARTHTHRKEVSKTRQRWLSKVDCKVRHYDANSRFSLCFLHKPNFHQLTCSVTVWQYSST